MRKLARIEVIDEVNNIEGADLIQHYSIGGWKVVAKKDEYKVGDKVVYCEIDSWIPHDLAPYLSKNNIIKEYQGVRGNRLKTVKLRGAISQGLILPLPQEHQDKPVGTDLSTELGIIKWEDLTQFHSGNAKGSFPSFIQKTDQERIQNCYNDVKKYLNTKGNLDTWQIEEKLEGSSCTVARFNDEVYLCSRNQRIDETAQDNIFVKGAETLLKIANHKALEGYALQGELIGVGVQGNIYNLNALEVRVFDIYDIKKARYLLPIERTVKIIELQRETGYTIAQVPMVALDVPIKDIDLDLLLNLANGNSELNNKTLREGIVIKHNLKNITFKIISNQYLLKQK